MNWTPFMLVSLIALVSKSEETTTALLYSKVIGANYVTARELTYDLEEDGDGTIIRNVITRLIAHSQRNVMEYSYKLWISHRTNSSGVIVRGEDIVNKYFPPLFKTLLGQYRVRIINIRDGLVLKPIWRFCSIDDQWIYVGSQDRPTERVSWKFIPSWVNDRLFFTIFNPEHQQYLRLALARDGHGRPKAWGVDRQDADPELWYVQPIRHETHIILFYVTHPQYGHDLKLRRYVSSGSNLTLLGHSVNEGLSDQFGWFVDQN